MISTTNTTWYLMRILLYTCRAAKAPVMIHTLKLSDRQLTGVSTRKSWASSEVPVGMFSLPISNHNLFRSPSARTPTSVSSPHHHFAPTQSATSSDASAQAPSQSPPPAGYGTGRAAQAVYRGASWSPPRARHTRHRHALPPRPRLRFHRPHRPPPRRTRSAHGASFCETNLHCEFDAFLNLRLQNRQIHPPPRCAQLRRSTTALSHS
mmetsp:Transcript_2370/g.3696  ORF Transcript_2370/g.3696 Transcript_2370/m.3696 type:complete len:208 (-) Transcript_2370:23-646(-)